MAQPSRARPVLQFSAGGLVVDDRGQIVLIRARDLRNQPVWTLPKGALNPGEASADAAVREVREETGWRCEVVRELTAVTYWFQRNGQRIRKTVRWYLMRPLEKVGEHDHEVDEVLWTSPADARTRLRYESDLNFSRLGGLGSGRKEAIAFVGDLSRRRGSCRSIRTAAVASRPHPRDVTHVVGATRKRSGLRVNSVFHSGSSVPPGATSPRSASSTQSIGKRSTSRLTVAADDDMPACAHRMRTFG